ELAYHLSSLKSHRETSPTGGSRSTQIGAGAEPKPTVEPHPNAAMMEPDFPAYYADSVAIIGLSCHFPEAKDYRQFWQNLIQGRESIHFFSPEELARLNLPEAHHAN